MAEEQKQPTNGKADTRAEPSPSDANIEHPIEKEGNSGSQAQSSQQIKYKALKTWVIHGCGGLT